MTEEEIQAEIATIRGLLSGDHVRATDHGDTRTEYSAPNIAYLNKRLTELETMLTNPRQPFGFKS